MPYIEQAPDGFKDTVRGDYVMAVSNLGINDYAMFLRDVQRSWQWIDIPVTPVWTFASATTVNVPSDATLIYKKGWGVRYKQGGGFKYGYIVAIAPTVLTIYGGTSYTIANAPITDVSFCVDPANAYGFPVPLSWVPTCTSSVGTITAVAVNSATFVIRGGLLRADVDVTIANNGTGSGALLIPMPVVAAVVGTGVGRENQMTGLQLQVMISAASIVAVVFNYNNTYPAGTGYRIHISLEYVI